MIGPGVLTPRGREDDADGLALPTKTIARHLPLPAGREGRGRGVAESRQRLQRERDVLPPPPPPLMRPGEPPTRWDQEHDWRTRLHSTSLLRARAAQKHKSSRRRRDSSSSPPAPPTFLIFFVACSTRLPFPLLF